MRPEMTNFLPNNLKFDSVLITGRFAYIKIKLIYYFGWIQTNESGGLYSHTFNSEVSE